MNKLSETLLPHLTNEEEMSRKESLVAHNFTNEMLKQLNDKILAKIKTEDGSLILPLIFYNLNEEETVRFLNPKFPWILRKIIFPFNIAKQHKGYWKFAQMPPKKKKIWLKTKKV